MISIFFHKKIVSVNELILKLLALLFVYNT